MKTCTRCGITKSFTDFHRYAKSKDGRAYWCARCAAEYAAERKASKSAYDREYQERNRERIRAYQQEYHLANRDRRAYPSAVSTCAPIRTGSGWPPTSTGRDGSASISSSRSSPRDDVVARYGDGCAYCPGAFEELDHVKAICLGGHHTLDNVRPSCRQCNAVKAIAERRERRRATL